MCLLGCDLSSLTQSSHSLPLALSLCLSLSLSFFRLFLTLALSPPRPLSLWIFLNSVRVQISLSLVPERYNAGENVLTAGSVCDRMYVLYMGEPHFC